MISRHKDKTSVSAAKKDREMDAYELIDHLNLEPFSEHDHPRQTWIAEGQNRSVGASVNLCKSANKSTGRMIKTHGQTNTSTTTLLVTTFIAFNLIEPNECQFRMR